MRPHLLRWQWELYPDGHTRRLTLLVHLLTAPLFASGTLLLAASPWLGWRAALTGAASCVATLALQGFTHKREVAAPVPFLGPFDFASRFFVEQWVTFPRFVFSGKLAATWRASSP